MAKKVTAATMDGELSESVQQTVLWTAHHASMQRSDSSTLPTINTILLVEDHVSNDIDFQFHIMKLAMEYMNYINIGQTTDQPLYALKNKFQWSCPQMFPIKSYFPFFGGLHIEQILLRIRGQLIRIWYR